MARLSERGYRVEAARNTGIAAWVVSFGYNAGEPIAASLPDQLFDTLPAIAHHVATLGSRPRH